MLIEQLKTLIGNNFFDRTEKEPSEILKLSGRTATGQSPQTRASFLAGHLNAILLDPKKYVDVVPYQVENALRKQMMANNELNKFLSLPPEKGRLLARLGFEQKLRNQAKSARNTSREVMNKHAHNLSSVLMRLQTNEKKQRKLLIAEKLFRSKDPSNMELLSLYRQIQQAKSLKLLQGWGTYGEQIKRPLIKRRPHE